MPDENEQKVQEMADNVKAPAEPNIGANAARDEILVQVTEKIEDAESILVTLSKDPTVDEISAALGLTLMLDKLGKHVTAIFSGKTPNAVQFLDPAKTFEKNTDSLQDFIISLDKEKADHLRYKIEGDFVRVYITPYKTKIKPEDLEFSDGDVNVDLVICLDVQAVEDLDAALAEHGRMMHDAQVVNISNAIPGHIGGVEWNDGDSSSLSEMVVKLMDQMKQEMTTDIATALLTGIVAETERFSNEKTMPGTMSIASRLMEAGADQQLVSAHVMPEPSEDVAAAGSSAVSGDSLGAEIPAAPEVEPGSIEVNDDVTVETPGNPVEVSDNPAVEVVSADNPAVVVAPEVPESNNPAVAVAPEVPAAAEISPEEQLEQMISTPAAAAVGSLDAPAATPVMEELANAVPEVPAEPEVAVAPEVPAVSEVSAAPEAPVAPAVSEAPVVPETPVAMPSAEEQLVAAVPTAAVPVNEVYEAPEERTDLENGVVAPLDIEQPKDYGAMMEEALAEDVPGATPGMVAGPIGSGENPAVSANGAIVAGENPAVSAAPTPLAQPEVQPVEQPMVGAPEQQSVSDMVDQMVANATAGVASSSEDALLSRGTESAAPSAVPSSLNPSLADALAGTVPEVNAGPELPPPPAPPIDMSMPPEGPSLPPVQPPAIEQVMPEAQVAQPVVEQPVTSEPQIATSEMQAPVAQIPAQPEVPAQDNVPAVPQDNSAVLGIPEAPAGVEAPAEPVNPVVVQPGPDPASVPPVQDPGAFKIPGM